MNPDGTVFVVDDDEAVRTALSRLMKSVELPVETFPTAEAFLETYDRGRPGCVVLDVRMPGMGGLALQEWLAREELRIPVIIISAHGDVETAVLAMKIGAVDFIRKPYDAKKLLGRIRHALALDDRIRAEEQQRSVILAALARLTRREREVMNLVVEGRSSKQIALDLGISRKTVDIHRSHLMTKLDIDSVAELVRMAAVRGSPPEGTRE